MSKGALWGVVIAIVIILIILYFAFGSKSAVAPTSDTAVTPTQEAAPMPTSTTAAPTVAGETRTLPDGLIITDVNVGDGPIEAKPHDVIIAHYTGMLENGKVFDSSIGKTPLKLPIGEGRVIKGWDEGLLGMRKGGKRHLVIPGALAYGATPPPGSGIPPNATLVFDVEMVDVWQALVNQPPK